MYIFLNRNYEGNRICMDVSRMWNLLKRRGEEELYRDPAGAY